MALCEYCLKPHRWVQSLEEEFYRQGDREKAAGVYAGYLAQKRTPVWLYAHILKRVQNCEWGD